jgi:hypothetical protein
MACFNCESTSSAMVMTSSSTLLKSTFATGVKERRSHKGRSCSLGEGTREPSLQALSPPARNCENFSCYLLVGFLRKNRGVE